MTVGRIAAGDKIRRKRAEVHIADVIDVGADAADVKCGFLRNGGEVAAGDFKTAYASAHADREWFRRLQPVDSAGLSEQPSAVSDSDHHASVHVRQRSAGKFQTADIRMTVSRGGVRSVADQHPDEAVEIIAVSVISPDRNRTSGNFHGTFNAFRRRCLCSAQSDIQSLISDRQESGRRIQKSAPVIATDGNPVRDVRIGGSVRNIAVEPADGVSDIDYRSAPVPFGGVGERQAHHIRLSG